MIVIIIIIILINTRGIFLSRGLAHSGSVRDGISG